MKEVILEYIQRIELEKNEALAVIGSHAIGEEKTWSDVDLIILSEEAKPVHVEIYKDQYFTITYYTEDMLAHYFKDTEKMFIGIPSFSNMRVIIDPEQKFTTFSEKCKNFKTTSVHLEHSLYKAKTEYIGYIEEAQKALQGLIDHHNGKMLLGLYGLTYGMFRVLALRDGLKLESENDFYDNVMEHLDDRDPIKDIAPHAFGLEMSQLVDQVEAGLELFMHVGNSLMTLFDEEEKKYGMKLIQEIIKVV